MTAAHNPARTRRAWRAPTIADIAAIAGVGAATVDRVLNGRSGVREGTRRKVTDALKKLRDRGFTSTSPQRRIAFLVESGASFNRSVEAALQSLDTTQKNVSWTLELHSGSELNLIAFAQSIQRAAKGADGLVIVSRQDSNVRRAVRAVSARGVPVVCATTDLPNSDRLVYVGNDQESAGATAAHLMRTAIGRKKGRILLVVSAPYRCQEERELGFRRVLRRDFPELQIDERVSSNDEPDYSYEKVRQYIDDHGKPDGIYNVAGGNRGIARALESAKLLGQVVLISHELTESSRVLLESNKMDFVIGHDIAKEIELSISAICDFLDFGRAADNVTTGVHIHTKYNC
jgi:LacI family transcriptional regulator